MLAVIRLCCAAYWVLLTALLMTPDPFALLGIERLRHNTPSTGVHFAFFIVLAVLTLSSRLPLCRLAEAGLLVGFAIATELLQRYVPPRTVDARDLLENLLGLLVGAIAWHATLAWGLPRLKKPAPEGDSR